jgi:hypothetical protein
MSAKSPFEAVVNDILLANVAHSLDTVNRASPALDQSISDLGNRIATIQVDHMADNLAAVILVDRRTGKRKLFREHG